MNVEDQINSYLQSLPEPKRHDMQALHDRMLQLRPGCKLWYFDGKDEKGKVVTNPQIGYGYLSKLNADGKTKEIFQVGISANSTGISVYIMGIDDKMYLPDTYGSSIGKATVTGYCIKFKAMKDIRMEKLESAIMDGFKLTS